MQQKNRENVNRSPSLAGAAICDVIFYVYNQFFTSTRTKMQSGRSLAVQINDIFFYSIIWLQTYRK